MSMPVAAAAAAAAAVGNADEILAGAIISLGYRVATT